MGPTEKYSEDEFRKLSKHLPDLIYQFTRRPDGSYHIPIASAGIENIFGCKPEDVKDSFDAITKVIHPEDLKKLLDKIEYCATHLTEFEIEFRVCIPGKPIQWILARSTPEKLPDGSVTAYGFIANFTEQKKALEQQEALTKKLNAVLKSIPDLVFEIGANGIIYDYHSQVNDLLAAPPELFIGRKFSDIIPKDAVDVLLSAIEETNQKGYSNGKQYELTLPHGIFWFELSVAPFQTANQLDKRYIVLSRNITERKQVDDKLTTS